MTDKTNIFTCVRRRLLLLGVEFIKDKSGDGEAENGCYVHHGPIYLCLAWTTFTGGVVAAVLKQFFAEDTLELAGRLALQLVEALTQGTGKRTSLNLPELSHLHLRRVHLQCSTHGREEPRLTAAGKFYKKQLVF